jgi:predicted CXXCH cytochrome family protein
MYAWDAKIPAGIFSAMFVVCMSAAPCMAGPDTNGGCITRDCHKGMLSQKFVHGPVAVELCEQCHVRTGKHAFRIAASGEELCYICHERGRAKKVNCVKCHDPHGSGLEFQLKPGSGSRCKK